MKYQNSQTEKDKRTEYVCQGLEEGNGELLSNGAEFSLDDKAVSGKCAVVIVARQCKGAQCH